MSETFTTLLYLFSSLLQADATILGFGAIFVIYKLQVLENNYQYAVNFILEHGGSASRMPLTEYMNIDVDVEANIDAIAEFIIELKSRALKQKYAIWMKTIPMRINSIKQMVRIPIIIIGTHCGVTAIILWLTAYINWLQTWWGVCVVCIFILTFSIGIVLSVRVAMNMVVIKDELSLEKNLPKVFERLKELN